MLVPQLNAGLAFSDRIEALLDGRVSVEGCCLGITCRPPQALFKALLEEKLYDLGEMSLGSHVAAVAEGRSDYVGVPVFLSRAFRHSNVYIRKGQGVERPEDLRGRRIGIADYQQTAGIWMRGILSDDYGVERDQVEWVTGGLAAPVLKDRTAFSPPPGLNVRRAAQSLNALLDAGEIDALISPVAPRAFIAGDNGVGRLWPHYRDVELTWYRRTQVFPPMHVLVLRSNLVANHPRLPEALLTAFDAARILAAADLIERDYPKICTPWLMADRGDTLERLGRDPWTYGVEANREALKMLLRYAEADGLASAGLAPEDLFHKTHSIQRGPQD